MNPWATTHRGLAIYIKKYCKAKRRIMETQIKIHHAKIPIFIKSSSKRNQNPSRYYYTSISNPRFQHKPKVSHSFKNPHIKIELLYYYLGGVKIP
jgi:hypothetical protein